MVAHLPCEVPQFNKQFYRFPFGKSTTLILRPTMIDTINLEGYKPELRQCYYEGEKKLLFFKNYTRLNCQLECTSRWTLDHCGCVHFSSPCLWNESICDKNQSRYCYKEQKKNLTNENMKNSLKSSRSLDDRSNIICGCLPACTSLSYEAELSHDDIRYYGNHPRSE